MSASATAPHWRHERVARIVCVVVIASLVLAPLGAVDVVHASDPAPARAVYEGDNGHLHIATADGSTVDLGITAGSVGQLRPLDGDEYLEAPFVSNGALRTVDVTGETETLVANGVKATPIGVGDRDGDGDLAIYYANSNGKLVRYENNSTQKLTDSTNNAIATNGILGVADYDSDDDRDLVFLGSSSTVKYYNGSAVESTGFSSFGTNNGVGVGTPADFNNDGAVRVPYVGGSGTHVKFLAPNGTTTRTIDVGTVSKTQIGVVDWSGETTREILFVNSTSPKNLYVAHLNGSVEPVRNAQGQKIPASTDIGVAGAVNPPAPSITNYSVSNPEGREIQISFDASANLTNISVEISGAESATLTADNFTETDSNPRHYTGTYVGNVDGNYTATLVTAEGQDGYNGADGQNRTVNVATPYPSVTNATVMDATDNDSVVAGGDEIRVTANVTHDANLTAVVADASAFGAGNVSLHETSDDTYAANLTVNASAVPEDGDQSVQVIATNEYDHSGANRTAPILVDTTPPTADAGPNRTVKEDTKVGFDADGSTDNDQIVRYVWAFGDDTNATGVTATHTYVDPGTYTVELTVYDEAGHATTDTKTVDVTDTTAGGPPEITNYSVTNPGNREIRVTFESNETLEDINVDISGAESGMLTESEFSASGTDPIHYTGTYTGDVDGNYTATLVTAEGTDGYNGANGENQTVEVDTPAPSVTNATLIDATDSDGLVAGGDRISVAANVTHEANLTDVVADASAFGAGNISLTRTSNETFATTVTVDAPRVPEDGVQSIPVRATNENGYTDTDRTTTITVDTTPPTADAGPNRTVEEGTDVGFDASGSTDNTGVTRYVWAFGDGSNATGATATHTYTNPGTYTATVTVYDAVGHSATDTKTIEVSEAPESGGSSDDDSTTGGSSPTGGGSTVIIDETDDSSQSTGDDEFSKTITAVNASHVQAEIGNADDGRLVALSLPESNTTEQTGGHLAGVSLRADRSGDFDLAVHRSSTAPSGIQPLTSNRSATAISYPRLTHEFSTTAVEDTALTFEVRDAALGPHDPDDVVVYRYENESWQPLTTAVVDTSGESNRYRVSTEGFSTFALGVRQPSTSIVNTTLQGDVTTTGDIAVIAATIENQGTADGTTSLSLGVDGTTVTTRNTSLEAADTRRVLLTHEFNTPGTHTLTLNGEQIGTVTVEEPAEEPSTVETSSVDDSGNYLRLAVVLLALLIGSIGIREQLE